MNLIFAANFRTVMVSKSIKSLLVAVLALFMASVSMPLLAQETPHKTVIGEPGAVEEKLDPAKIIMEHIKDNHEFHFFTAGDFHATVPLPVIIYSKTRGLESFSSARFGHEGEETYNGYRLHEGKIISENGTPVYDFSITKNVVQMILALIVLVLLMIGIAKKIQPRYWCYKCPEGLAKCS